MERWISSLIMIVRESEDVHAVESHGAAPVSRLFMWEYSGLLRQNKGGIHKARVHRVPHS